MPDVFISYAHEDRTEADALAAALKERGLSVWWDRTIRPGTSFDQAIERELAAARCVVVLWSANSVASNWVRAEANEALDRGTLLPVSLDGTLPPLQFRLVQTLAMERGSPSGLQLVSGEAARYVASGIRPVRNFPSARALADTSPAPSRPFAVPITSRIRRRQRDRRVLVAALALAALLIFGGIAATLAMGDGGEADATSPATDTLDVNKETPPAERTPSPAETPLPANVQVPNVFGKNPAVAVGMLRELGFAVNDVRVCSSKPVDTVRQVVFDNGARPGSPEEIIVVDEQGVVINSLPAGTALLVKVSNGAPCS